MKNKEAIHFVGDLEIRIILNENTNKFEVYSPVTKLLVEGDSHEEVFKKLVEQMKIGQ